MFDHSLICLCLLSLLMSTAYCQPLPGETTTQDPQGGGPTEPVAQGGHDLCSMNETEVNSTIGYSFMAGSHLYLINGSLDFLKMAIDPFQSSIESVSAQELFPDSGYNAITAGLYFSGFNCKDASIDANANGTDPAGSGSGAGISPAPPGSDDCTKANDLFLLFGKRSKVEFKPYRLNGGKFEAVKDNKELPWGIVSGYEDYSYFGPKFGHDKDFPNYHTGLFDNDKHRLYIFGTVSQSNPEPTLHYKQFNANGTFEKGKFTRLQVNQTYWGSMMKKDKIYVMSKSTNSPIFHELSIRDSDATEEQSFPLKKFMDCDDDSPLKEPKIEGDNPLLPEGKGTVTTTPSDGKKSSWIIWLIILLILVAIVITIISFFCCCNKSEAKPEEGAPGEARPPSQSGEMSKRSGLEGDPSNSKAGSSTGAPATGSTALAKPSGSGSSTGSATGPKSQSKTGPQSSSKAVKPSSKSSIRSSLSAQPSSIRSKL